MIYTAPFHASLFGSITLATVGETDAVLSIASLTSNDSDSASSSIFWHSPNATTFAFMAPQTNTVLGFFRTVSITAFYAAVEAGLEAQMGGWTTPSALEVTVNFSDPHNTVPSYTFAWPVANFSLTFSNAATAALFGFATTSNTGAQTYTGTQTPTYMLVPTQTAGSDPSVEYEPQSVATHISTDEGQGTGMSRTIAPLHQDWVQQYETREKTFKAAATATHPWTFQHLFEYCRGEYPFALYRPGFYRDADNVTAHYLRTEGANWAPQPHSPGNASQFFIPFRTEVGGYYEIAS